MPAKDDNTSIVGPSPVKKTADMRAYKRAYNAANREKIREQHQAWWAQNKVSQTEYQKAYAKANPEKIKANRERNREKERKRRRHRRFVEKYNLTPDDVMCLLAVQGNRCAACDAPFAVNMYNIDHCHATGKVRGILCGPCNRAAGMLGDDPSRLRKLLAYLEKYRRPASG